MTLIKVPPDRRYIIKPVQLRFEVDVDMPPNMIPIYLKPFLEQGIKNYEKVYDAEFQSHIPLRFEYSPIQGAFDEIQPGNVVEPGRRWWVQGKIDVVVIAWFREPLVWIPTGQLEEERKAIREEFDIELPEKLQKYIEDKEKEAIKGERVPD